MTFINDNSEPIEFKYISTVDSKIYIFDTYFILNNKKIEMKLKIKEEAKAV
jgi:hypothetical protein